VAVHPAGLPDPERLGDFLSRHGVTTAWLTAGLFHQVVDAGAPGCGGLRRLVAGGDVLSPAHVARARELLPDTRLVNGYGPTETTTFACCHVVSGDETGAIPVGRPIAGAHAYLLDAAMRPVPVGVPGELYVGGGGVARGYVTRPGATAERFVPDPFSEGGRLYRTGDRARWNRRGEVEFLGRLDRQAKVRGFRVEPGEVEAVLRAHPAVADAVVDVLGEGDARRLAAWIVPIGGAAPSMDALRAHAAERLPAHLVPSAFVAIDALPLTPNGKVDRRALPAPDLGTTDGFVAPAGPTEEIVAGIWADLLEIKRVGAADDFFHLGGHSLLATRAISRLRAAFGVDVPLRALFEHPTVAGLAAEMDRLRGAASTVAPPEIDAAEVPDGGEAPVSFAQERMWFLDQLEPGTSSLAIPHALRLRGALDAAALKRALEEVVRRHQALRTVFPERDGVPVQRVVPAGPVDLPLHDLRGLGDAERDEAADAIARRVAEAPFDLARGPLLRVELARLGDEEHAAFTCVHHAVSDGWSLSLFLSEWTAIYAAFARGEPSPLAEPALQYPRFAAWQREWLRGEALEAQIDYWRRALDGAPPRLELPTDRPRPPVQGHRGALETAAFPRELSDAVLALGRREGSTLFMVLLAALDVVFTRWTGQSEIVVGTPIAGRTRRETEGVIGLFLNTLALRVDLSGDPGFAGLLARVREAALGAYAHQDVPFEAVLAAVGVERDLSRSPVFQVMLNLTNFEGAQIDVPGLSVEPYGHADDPPNKFDLTLYVGEGAEGIVANLVYDAALFDAPRMRALLAQLQAVLAQAVDDPSRPLSTFSLATDAVLPDPKVGREIDGAGLLVLAPDGRPAGIGELGEIASTGDGAGGLHRTGDLGRYRLDGTVEIAVRPDSTPPAEPEAAAVEPVANVPPTATEEAVAAIWREVLGADEVGAGEDFFALGGHSLRVTQVLSRIQARMGVTLSVRDFFAAPTVRRLAAAVDAVGPEHRIVVAEEPVAAVATYPPGVYPLSIAQQGLWMRMQPGSGAARNIADALRFTGPLDVWALEHALTEIVRRHEPLRTKIELRDGEPVQVVQPERPVRLRARDVDAADSDARDAEYARLAEEEAIAPFPAEGPFFRATLLRADDDDHVLLCTAHPMAFDERSRAIFRDELLALYRAFAADEPSPLAEPPITYGSHALRQRQEMSGGAVERLAAWWKERMTGAPALLDLPTDRPRPTEPRGETAVHAIHLAVGRRAAVEAFARERGATPFMVLLAAFQAVLGRWAGQDDVIVGTPVASRPRAELEPLIGRFAGTLPLRGDLSGDPTFRALVDRARETTLAAHAHQDLPFEALAEAPALHAMFIYPAAASEGIPSAIGAVEVSEAPHGRATSPYDLTLALRDGKDSFAGTVEYAVGLFDAVRVERMTAQLDALLTAALDAPDTPLSALSPSDQERPLAVET
jgi:non-ribosomal peptide synthetase component F/acyl carrier protein